MSQGSTIEQAIAQAQAAAANSAGNVQGMVTEYAPASAPAVGRAAPLDVMDMLAGGSITPDAWLKVGQYGLIIGDGKPFDSVEVTLNFADIGYCYSVRYGDPAKYEKSYDRVTNARGGGSWADTLARAQRIDPKAGEFRSADIPFVVNEDVKNKDAVVLEAGKILGHSLSITGWRPFQAFLRDCAKKGIDIQNGSVVISLGYEVQKNAKGVWGTLTFNDPKVVN